MRVPSSLPAACLPALLSLAVPSAAEARSDAAAEPWPATGDVVVRFEVTPPTELLDRLRRDPRVEGLQRARGSWPLWLVEGRADPEALRRDLARLPGVRWAELDRLVPARPMGPPVDDPWYPEQWHLHNVGQNTEWGLPGSDVGAPEAWAITAGEGQLIAIMDSGVDADHPDLDVRERGLNVDTGAFDPRPDPDLGNANHGTAVAGLAAAIGDNGIGVAGVAYGAEIIGVKLLGGDVSLFGMYNAYAFVVDEGATVVNNSWGFGPDECGPIPEYATLQDAMSYVAEEGRGGLGAVNVFATGNDGCFLDSYPMVEHPGVIGVGAINDQDRHIGYSNWGPLVDVVAPSGAGNGGRSGALLTTTDHSGEIGNNDLGDDQEYTRRMSGTSASTPVAAGVAALVLAANPRLTQAQVQDVLCATAVRVDPEGGEWDATGWSPYYGCGRVHAGAAVRAVHDLGGPEAPAWLELDFALPANEQALAWSAVEDPDGDPVTYALRIENADDESQSFLFEGLTNTHWVAPEPLPLDSAWFAWVTASDEWGPGPTSERFGFVVVDPLQAPEGPEPEGSGCGGGSAAWLLWISAWLGFAAGRRAGHEGAPRESAPGSRESLVGVRERRLTRERAPRR